MEKGWYYLREMQKCVDNKDFEVAHSDADELLCALLNELGCKKLTDLYGKVTKHYS